MGQEQSEIRKIQETAKISLLGVLAAKKNRNQEWAARASGMAKSTISNLLNKNKLLTPATLVSLCRFLLTDLNRNEVAKEQQKILKQFLKENETETRAKADETLSDKMERYLLENDDIDLRTLLLASHASGVSAKQLYELGQAHLDSLSKFMQKKWIYEEDGKYHAVIKQFYFKSHQLTRRLANLAVQTIRTDRFNKNSPSDFHNFCMVIDESLNKEAINEIVADLVKLTNKIEKFLHDPKKKGNEHFLFLGVVDSLTYKK